MFSFLKPSPAIERLPENQIDNVYKQQRIKVFLGIFIGYAGYYLVRKNFALAMPELIKEGFSRGELGIAFSGVSIAYGLSKFFMGNVSDRSNPKYFMPLGLFLSALIMLILGFAPFALASVPIIFILLFSIPAMW